MTEPRREPRSDLVSFGPTNTDTGRFTVGLWATETALFAFLLLGFTVLRGLSVGLTVSVACAAMVWFASVTAIVLRGRLQPVPGGGRRVLAIVAAVAFAAWLVLFLARALGGELTTAGLIGFDIVGLLLESAALISAYFSRMFRWRADLFTG